MELLDQLEAENPEDPALAPKVSTAAARRVLRRKQCSSVMLTTAMLPHSNSARIATQYVCQA